MTDTNPPDPVRLVFCVGGDGDAAVRIKLNGAVILVAGLCEQSPACHRCGFKGGGRACPGFSKKNQDVPVPAFIPLSQFSRSVGLLLSLSLAKLAQNQSRPLPA